MTPEDKELVEQLRNDKIRGIYWAHDKRAEKAAAAIERLSAEVAEFESTESGYIAAGSKLAEELAALRAQIAEAQPDDYVGELVADNDGYPWLRVRVLDPDMFAKAGKGAKVYIHPTADAKDAARYRRVRKAAFTHHKAGSRNPDNEEKFNYDFDKEYDAEIDAAMKGEKK